ncbi:MAG: histidinol-phosphatase [Clostridia bacterium]|nr:histidinol-phosphatase [Clostridia bacterium]
MNHLSNLHTHSTFCDGKNTPEQIVMAAIDKGFSAIGFSGHGYTPFDLRYCMKDTAGYIAEIRRLKSKYQGKITILLGIEEDAFAPADRKEFDYVIGSSHYYCIDGKYLPIDSNYDYFKKCLEAFEYDVVRMAEVYYSSFCAYIQSRKPDIIGHFDLITKFDKLDRSLFLENAEYRAVAEKYVLKAAECDCLFEVNTGAITRGLRSTPYPAPHLLHVLKKQNAKLILSSDSHVIDTLDGVFEETKDYLYDIGFRHAYAPTDSGFAPYRLKN